MYRMHYFEYLTLEEIASEMGITRERVRACTEYIRRKIISAMSHYETVYKRNKELEILNAELQNFIEKQLKINKFFLFTEEDIARLKQNVFLSEAQIEHLKQTGFFTQEQIALLIESAGKIEAEAAARAASPKIIDMDISVRILNCLKAADIETLYDLRKYKKEDMLKFRNIGKKSLAELTEVMRRYGIEW
ncbi:MAG: hypothetical protein HY063_03485 [Bacteroidetes bacterium]|nr:hypothetical protein [Bacteroidota bacterium]